MVTTTFILTKRDYTTNHFITLSEVILVQMTTGRQLWHIISCPEICINVKQKKFGTMCKHFTSNTFSVLLVLLICTSSILYLSHNIFHFLLATYCIKISVNGLQHTCTIAEWRKKNRIHKTTVVHKLWHRFWTKNDTECNYYIQAVESMLKKQTPHSFWLVTKLGFISVNMWTQ